MRKSASLTAVIVLGCSLAMAADFDLHVVDPQGAVVAGAVVQIRCARADGRSIEATTDETGSVRARCELPADIRVTSPGFDPLVRRVDAILAEGLTLRLSPALLHTTVDVVIRELPGLEPSVGSAVAIERNGARTVFDAVEKLVPGAYVTRRGVMGYGIATNGTGVVSIRGIGEQPNAGVLVVVDGRPDYQGLFGHPLPDFYSLSDAANVSVTEGPASVLYGSNAMGGVIEVKPSYPHHGFDTRLTSSLGSYWTGQHRLSHGARLGRGFYALTAGVSHTNGDRPNSAFHSQDGTVALGYDLSPIWKASLEGRYGHFHVEDPGPVSAPLQDSFAAVGRGGVSLGFDNSKERTWGYARIYSSHGRNFITDGFRSVDSATGVRVQQSFMVNPRFTLDGGSDVVVYGGRARNVATQVDFGEHHLTAAAGFSRAQWTPFSRLRLNAGVRYEHNSAYGGIVVPEWGAVIRLSSNYSLATSIARGFRNPTLRELYLFPAPNPLLKPERLWNYQATFQARPRNSLKAWTTFYYADLSNLIVTTGRFPLLALSNAGRALNRGLEANASWKPLPRLSFNSGYAYLRSTNLAPYVPQHKLNYSLDWEVGATFLHFGGMTVGPTWADPGRAQQLGGYTVATLKATFPLERPYSFFLMLDNLFNRRYEVVAGYPMPGINALAGFSVHF